MAISVILGISSFMYFSIAGAGLVDKPISSEMRISSGQSILNVQQVSEQRHAGSDVGPLGGIWEGAYSCAQGQTGLRLNINQVSHNRFQGVFEFRLSNGQIGSFRISGIFDPETGRVEAVPGAWIKRVPRFSTVSFMAKLIKPSETRFLLKGEIRFPGCGPMVVERHVGRFTREVADKKSRKPPPLRQKRQSSSDLAQADRTKRDNSFTGNPVLRIPADQPERDQAFRVESTEDASGAPFPVSHLPVSPPEKDQSDINIGGIWKGVFRCGQNNFEFNLDLTVEPGDRIKGVVTFGASIAQGASHTVIGAFHSRDRSIILKPRKWINRPSNKQDPARLYLNLSNNGRALSGELRFGFAGYCPVSYAHIVTQKPIKITKVHDYGGFYRGAYNCPQANGEFFMYLKRTSDLGLTGMSAHFEDSGQYWSETIRGEVSQHHGNLLRLRSTGVVTELLGIRERNEAVRKNLHSNWKAKDGGQRLEPHFFHGGKSGCETYAAERIPETKLRAAEVEYIQGVRSEIGHGVPKDLNKALVHYRSAARSEQMDALYRLGRFHENGIIVPKDLNLAMEYYKRAAVFGHPMAKFNLARFYAEGKHVKKDESIAFRYFVQNAKRGHKMSHLHALGMQAIGAGTKAAPAKAESQLSRYLTDQDPTIRSEAKKLYTSIAPLATAQRKSEFERASNKKQSMAIGAAIILGVLAAQAVNACDPDPAAINWGGSDCLAPGYRANIWEK